MTKYHHGLLWPNATTFERSQRGYLQPKSSTVPCDQRPHHSRSLSSAAAAVLMPLVTSFLVAWVPATAAASPPMQSPPPTPLWYCLSMPLIQHLLLQPPTCRVVTFNSNTFIVALKWYSRGPVPQYWLTILR